MENKIANKIKWFDVCNDYSLSKRDKPADLHLYTSNARMENDIKITEYCHKEYNELHYTSLQRV